MRYYCKSCGAEWSNVLRRDNKVCPFCKQKGHIVEVCKYETVSQWEARTGQEYPETAPVYMVRKDTSLDRTFWFIERYSLCNDYKAQFILIVATEKGAPPADWRPRHE